jgi:spore maturation protein CgeB
MRISFFGSSLVSSYWNGAATYYRGLLKAMAALGYQVTFYEPDAYERQKHRDIPDPDWARSMVYPATEDGWRRALDEAIGEADLIVKASGVGVFDAELETAIPDIAPARAMIALWDVDAPATLESIAADPRNHLRQAIPRYDLVLTYGGGQPVVSGYLRLGARQCVPVYNGVDPHTHFPTPERSAFACDLSFLGNRMPDREARVEEFFLVPASRLPNRKFLLGGSGWDTKQLPANVSLAGHVGTADHNAFFCSSLATLNINRDSMARFGFSPPTRIFEAAGCGSCVVSDAWPGIEEFFEPNREILVAHGGEGVAALLEELSPPDARHIGLAARRRALAEHTYGARARQVARILGDTARKGEAAA